MKALRAPLVVLLCSALCIAQVQVQSTFFGMCVNRISSFPATVPIGSLRLWGTGTGWGHLCPTGPNCNWEHLDKWLAAAKANGITDVMYTFGKVPAWIAAYPPSRPQTAECQCFPPKDVTPDGGGSDEAWKGFVKALVEHNQRLDSNHAKIRYWGMWNEPSAKNFWQGTDSQLVRMAKDAYSIIKAADPAALVLSPELGNNSREPTAAADYFDHYLAAGGGQYADVMAFHMSSLTVNPGGHPVVEDVVQQVTSMKKMMARHAEVASKPLWMTEGQWGRTDLANWKDPNQEASFVVRFYTLIASLGVQRIYWYVYDPVGLEMGYGGLVGPDGTETAAAAGYKAVHKWLLGRTVSNCSLQGHVWSCDLTGPGYKGEVVWYDEYEKTTSYNAAGFASYQDIFGGVNPLDQKTHTITLGNTPVLLETSGKRP